MHIYFYLTHPIVGGVILSEIENLIKDIDTLKKNLNELIEKKGFNLQDPEIIKASQELDIVIAKYNDLITKKL